MKSAPLALAVTLFLGFAAMGEDKNDPKPEATRTGHFEKNNSGLKGDQTFLILRVIESFE